MAGAPAVAQMAPPVAPPTREEVQRAPVRPPADARPRLTVDDRVERAPCALASEANRDVRFTLRSVVFEELKGLSPQALRPAYAELVGTEQPVSAICEIRDRAATILRDAGYVAAVEIPEQRIADGALRFQVLTARLVAVRVRGNAGRAERAIAAYLERLTREEVFNRNVAERYLLLAGDIPGFDVRLTLRSAEAGRGEVIGEVAVIGTAGRADLNVQNFGSRDLGRFGGLLRGEVYGLTGLGDRTTVGVFSTLDIREQQTLQLGHDFRLGGEGLVLSGQFTYARAAPDLDSPDFRVRARTLLGTVEASFPFLRSQADTVRGALGLDLIDQRVRFNGLPLTRDRLRVGYLRLDADVIDPNGVAAGGGGSVVAARWRAAASLQLRRGLDILGASDGCGPGLVRCQAAGVVTPSRLQGDATGRALRAEALAEVRPVPAVSVALGVRGQISPDPLLSFEEFSGGNYTAGRGYDPGTLLGDSGVGMQAELRFDGLRRSRNVGLQPYVFADLARVRNEDFANRGDVRQDLSSVGGGVRASYRDRVQLDAALAVPLQRAGLLTERPDPRFLLSITTSLWTGGAR